MNNTLKVLLLASSLTSANAASLDQETNEIIADTESYISNTLDASLPPKEFERKSDLNVINANGEYFFIEGNNDSGYKMHTTSIENIPNDAICKNYSGEPVFYVGNTKIKELGSWQEEKIGDDKFSEFKKMPNCDTAGVKTLASNIN